MRKNLNKKKIYFKQLMRFFFKNIIPFNLFYSKNIYLF